MRHYRSSNQHNQRGWAWLGPAIAAAGSVLSGDQNRKMAHEQMDAQREFAQMGIRWKVADAKAAGVHPLFALGANTHSYSPVQVGSSGVGEALQTMGQDISRSQLQTMTQEQRDQAFVDRVKANERQMKADYQNDILFGEQVTGQRQQNIGQQLDNEAKRLSIMRLQQSVGPAMPSTASEFGSKQFKPSEQVSADKSLPGLEAAPTPGFKTQRIGKGSIDLPGTELSETLEGMGVMGHILAPLLFGKHYYDKWKPGVSEWFSDNLGTPPKGKKRVFNPRTREFELRDN